MLSFGHLGRGYCPPLRPWLQLPLIGLLNVLSVLDSSPRLRETIRTSDVADDADRFRAPDVKIIRQVREWSSSESWLVLPFQLYKRHGARHHCPVVHVGSGDDLPVGDVIERRDVVHGAWNRDGSMYRKCRHISAPTFLHFPLQLSPSPLYFPFPSSPLFPLPFSSIAPRRLIEGYKSFSLPLLPSILLLSPFFPPLPPWCCRRCLE